MARPRIKMLSERVKAGFRSGLRHPERWQKRRAVSRHRARRRLLERLQLLAGLEPHSFPRRDRDFCACAGVAADTSLAWTHVEDSEAAQFDAFAAAQSALHALEHGFHGHF